jgi:hypothetical protein
MSIMRLTSGDISVVFAVSAALAVSIVIGGAAGSDVQGVDAADDRVDEIRTAPLRSGRAEGRSNGLGGERGTSPTPRSRRERDAGFSAAPVRVAPPSRRRGTPVEPGTGVAAPQPPASSPTAPSQPAPPPAPTSPAAGSPPAPPPASPAIPTLSLPAVPPLPPILSPPPPPPSSPPPPPSPPLIELPGIPPVPPLPPLPPLPPVELPKLPTP